MRRARLSECGSKLPLSRSSPKKQLAGPNGSKTNASQAILNAGQNSCAIPSAENAACP